MTGDRERCAGVLDLRDSDRRGLWYKADVTAAGLEPCSGIAVPPNFLQHGNRMAATSRM